LDSTGAKRSQMLEVSEQIVRQAAAFQQDSSRGQTSLFEGMEEETAIPRSAPPEMHPSELLKGEKEALGFYLSGHPLSQHEQELEHYAVPLNDVAEWPDGASVRVAGLILDTHIGKVKRTNEPYARFQLEDLHAHIDVMAWPETYRKARALVQADRLVAVLGVVDKSGDRTQIVAQEIIALDEMAGKWAKTVNLKVNLVGIDEQVLERLRELCGRYPGQALVTFQLQTAHVGEVKVNAGEERRVRPTQEFLQEVVQLLGDDSVDISV